ncbi:cell division protein FtsL [Humitalea sp. 24SJ18S-53]|uniref:cell division protein FtsL n=1 Tax=Humitalea sp. 24SJ18S-53 TaxID=3422307 RepID=UPI003D6735D0
MIRPLTALMLLGAAGAGLHLYSVKQGTTLLERELRDIRRQTEAARERTQVLRAEWALLNEPDRLRQVVQRHLPLDAMAPAQFVRESDLARRLPAPVTFAGTPSLFAPLPGSEPAGRESVLVARAPEAPVATPVAATPVAATPVAAPVAAIAVAAVAPPRVAAPVAPPAAAPAAAPVTTATIASLAPPPRAAAPRPQAPPPPAIPAGGLQPPVVAPVIAPTQNAAARVNPPVAAAVTATALPPIPGTTQTAAARAPRAAPAPPAAPQPYAARPPAQLVRTPPSPATAVPPSVVGTPGQNIRPLLPPPVPYGSSGSGLISSATAATLTAQAGR